MRAPLPLLGGVLTACTGDASTASPLSPVPAAPAACEAVHTAVVLDDNQALITVDADVPPQRIDLEVSAMAGAVQLSLPALAVDSATARVETLPMHSPENTYHQRDDLTLTVTSSWADGLVCEHVETAVMAAIPEGLPIIRDVIVQGDAAALDLGNFITLVQGSLEGCTVTTYSLPDFTLWSLLQVDIRRVEDDLNDGRIVQGADCMSAEYIDGALIAKLEPYAFSDDEIPSDYFVIPEDSDSPLVSIGRGDPARFLHHSSVLVGEPLEVFSLGFAEGYASLEEAAGVPVQLDLDNEQTTTLVESTAFSAQVPYLNYLGVVDAPAGELLLGGTAIAEASYAYIFDPHAPAAPITFFFNDGDDHHPLRDGDIAIALSGSPWAFPHAIDTQRHDGQTLLVTYDLGTLIADTKNEEATDPSRPPISVSLYDLDGDVGDAQTATARCSVALASADGYISSRWTIPRSRGNARVIGDDTIAAMDAQSGSIFLIDGACSIVAVGFRGDPTQPDDQHHGRWLERTTPAQLTGVSEATLTTSW